MTTSRARESAGKPSAAKAAENKAVEIKAAESQSTTDASSGAEHFSAREFRNAMGRFATGVIVVSTHIEGRVHAMTANAFMSGSLEPPLVLVSVARTARMHEKIAHAKRFGVSVLTSKQLASSNHFAGKAAAADAHEFVFLEGMAVIEGSSVQLAAHLEQSYPCGDHTLFVGRVTGLKTAQEESEPLLFHRGQYGAISPEARPSAG